jgi:hypothetical protein
METVQCVQAMHAAGTVLEFLPIFAEQESGGNGHLPLCGVVHHGYKKLVILPVLPVNHKNFISANPSRTTIELAKPETRK